MDGRPAEARLIHDRRVKAGLSIREAARRAGISEGSWRRTEGPRRLHRTQQTVARMAQVVAVTPAELEKAGRPDAARELAALLPLPAQPADVVAELRARIAALEALAADSRWPDGGSLAAGQQVASGY